MVAASKSGQRYLYFFVEVLFGGVDLWRVSVEYVIGFTCVSVVISVVDDFPADAVIRLVWSHSSNCVM